MIVFVFVDNLANGKKSSKSNKRVHKTASIHLTNTSRFLYRKFYTTTNFSWSISVPLWNSLYNSKNQEVKTMASNWFKCQKCGNEEARLIPSHVKVSETPCPKCGGKMVRK